MLLSDVKLRPGFKPADFKAQLFVALVDVSGRALLPFERFEWGQPFVKFRVTESGEFRGVAVYDREEGSEYLAAWEFLGGHCLAARGDTVAVTFNWGACA